MHHASQRCRTKMVSFAALIAPEPAVQLTCPAHRALLCHGTFLQGGLQCPKLTDQGCRLSSAGVLAGCFCPGFNWLLVKDGEESWLLTWGAATSGYLNRHLGATWRGGFPVCHEDFSQGLHLQLGCMGSSQHGLILAKAEPRASAAVPGLAALLPVAHFPPLNGVQTP